MPGRTGGHHWLRDGLSRVGENLAPFDKGLQAPALTTRPLLTMGQVGRSYGGAQPLPSEAAWHCWARSRRECFQQLRHPGSQLLRQLIPVGELMQTAAPRPAPPAFGPIPRVWTRSLHCPIQRHSPLRGVEQWPLGRSSVRHPGPPDCSFCCSKWRRAPASARRQSVNNCNDLTPELSRAAKRRRLE